MSSTTGLGLPEEAGSSPRKSPGTPGRKSTRFLPAGMSVGRKKGEKKEEAVKDPQQALEEQFLVINDASIESTPDPIAEISSILGRRAAG